MAVALVLAALLLPSAPAPRAPFPKILTDASTISQIAPGVQYGEYALRTADGPLSVHVLAVDMHEPSVRVGTSLANGTLVSQGETLSSMAEREGALAGINGDYFDINQTNQPLNLLVRDGKFIRSPMLRPVLAVNAQHSALISEFTVTEFAHMAHGVLPLHAMNDWPPQGSAALLVTPDYGTLRAAPGVRVAMLEPQSTAVPLAPYRVLAVQSADTALAAGSYLAFGPDADASLIPSTGDLIAISAQSSPPLDGIVSAVGGGPLLVRDGAWYADPHGPSSGEFATHMPASAAAITADGNLLLFEIDGRQPSLSIGVLQPQLASLMIAFGARTGMQFDGGGSSTMVARLAGDSRAHVLNSPSDGQERRIADALLVYSDVKPGPPVRLVTRPQTIRAVAGAHVNVLAAEVDEGGRTVRTFTIPFAAATPQQTLRIARDGFVAVVPVEIVDRPSLVEVLPEHALARSGVQLQLHARALDAGGYPLALPAELQWKSSTGSIDRAGVFTAGTSNAAVTVRVGRTLGTETVTVGEHEADLPFAAAASFATAPQQRPGALLTHLPCQECVTLQYDFTGDERAAYANVALALEQRSTGISMDVLGDGKHETLRAAVTNAIGERFLYTVATVDWSGWKHVELRFPPELPQPIALRSIYVISKIGASPAVREKGSLALRSVRVMLAGSAQSSPQ